MFAELFKLPVSAIRHGHINGIQVPRNPIYWVPFFVAIPFVCAVYLVFMLVIYPPLMLWMWIAVTRFCRKTAVFDDNGIRFTKAYGRAFIGWTEVREVCSRRDPTAHYYRLTTVPANTRVRDFIICATQDDFRFETEIQRRCIAFSRSRYDSIVPDPEVGADRRSEAEH
jgi:hypothetical protein